MAFHARRRPRERGTRTPCPLDRPRRMHLGGLGRDDAGVWMLEHENPRTTPCTGATAGGSATRDACGFAENLRTTPCTGGNRGRAATWTPAALPKIRGRPHVPGRLLPARPGYIATNYLTKYYTNQYTLERSKPSAAGACFPLVVSRNPSMSRPDEATPSRTNCHSTRRPSKARRIVFYCCLQWPTENPRTTSCTGTTTAGAPSRSNASAGIPYPLPET